MLEAGLVISRFVHYGAVLVLFGMALFPLYAYPQRTEPMPARLDTWIFRFMLWAALLALLSAIPWIALTAANMAGSMNAALDWETLSSVMRDTAFGQVWLARLALTLFIVALAILGFRRRLLLAGLTAALLASLAAVGHTQQTEGVAGILHAGADALHLLAAGAWIGGLIALAYVLAYREEDAGPVLLRFSGMGYVAVAALVASGLVNAWYLVGTFEGLVGTPYGQVLLVKLCLFAGMVTLAVSNRFWLVPTLTRGSNEGAVLPRLRRHVVAEEVLGLLIVLAVSFLGAMEPAVSKMSP